MTSGVLSWRVQNEAALEQLRTDNQQQEQAIVEVRIPHMSVHSSLDVTFWVLRFLVLSH